MIGKNVSIEKIFLTDYLKENEGYSECLGRYSEEGHCDRWKFFRAWLLWVYEMLVTSNVSLNDNKKKIIFT